MPSLKSPSIGDDFNHIIAYSMGFTLENDVGCAMEHEESRFGSLRGVIKGEEMKCLEQGKRCLKQGKKVLKEGFGSNTYRSL